jgi:sulfur-oxidizing protein SoxY
MNRRVFLLSGTALLAMPASATKPEVSDLIAQLTQGRPIAEGGMKLDVPELVENGNVVAMTVSVDPPQGVHVESLHVFADANPFPTVLHLRFGPASGRPRIATRIRLATSQTVTAIAKLSDGSLRSDSVSLLVTLAACLD